MAGPLVPASTVSFIEWAEEDNVVKLKAYWDGYRAWTIGFGHTGPEVVRGLTCTREQADAWLAQDLAASARNVDALVHVPLNENQRTVLISFDFNEGHSALASSTLLRRLNAGDYASVPVELARWTYARDAQGAMQYSAGLANRRTKEATLWATPSAVPAPAPPVPAPPILPPIPDAAPEYPAPPDAGTQPKPLGTSTTIWSTIAASVAGPAGMALAYVQSPYALVALAMVLAFLYFILRERFKHRAIGGV